MAFTIGIKKEIEKNSSMKITDCAHCKKYILQDDAVIGQYWLGGINESEYIFMHASCLIKQIREKDNKFFQKIVAEEI